MRFIVGIWKFFVSLISFVNTEQDERQHDFDEYRVRIFDPECNRLLNEYRHGNLLLTDFIQSYSSALRAMVSVFGAVGIVFDGHQRLVIDNESALMFIIYSDWVSKGKAPPPGVVILTSDMAGSDFKELRTKISVSNTAHGETFISSLHLDTTQDLLGLEFRPV